MKKIKSNKIGRVHISIEIINNCPDIVALVMGVFIPLRAEVMPQGWVEYIGICDRFEEREEGWATPQYDFIVAYDAERKPFIKEVNKL